MKIIKAPDPIPLHTRPAIFLAGGIQDCVDWRYNVETYFRSSDTDAMLLNPRQAEFGELSDEKVKEQIAWEYYAIETCDIFTMWFCESESDQPICMYELGRALWKKDTVCLGVAPGYSRKLDVATQVNLARPDLPISDSLSLHIERIDCQIGFWQDYHNG